MALVSLSTKCRVRHPFNRGRRTECEKIQKCLSQTCGSLKAQNPHLFAACEAHCQATFDGTQEDFLCGAIGADVLFNQYGISRCGFNPKKDSLQGQLYQEGKEKAWYIQQLPIIALAILVLLLLYYLIFRVLD